MNSSPLKILTIPLRLSLIILILGALFKVIHWPYSQLLMGVGGVLIMVLYTIRFLYKKQKLRLDYVKLVLILLWIISYVFKAFHFISFPYIFDIIVLVLFIWWLAEEGFSFFINRKLKNNGTLKVFYYTLIIITICCLVFGVLFKIQHWPYGNIIFTFGMLLMTLVLIVDYFVTKKY